MRKDGWVRGAKAHERSLEGRQIPAFHAPLPQRKGLRTPSQIEARKGISGDQRRPPLLVAWRRKMQPGGNQALAGCTVTSHRGEDHKPPRVFCGPRDPPKPRRLESRGVERPLFSQLPQP